MIQRCTNPGDQRYPNYGGRGIKVCQRWSESFVAFLRDMGDRPAGKGPGGRSLYSIDRIDNDGDYEPGNCKWSTNIEQHRRTRRSHMVGFGGETKSIATWARERGMSPPTLLMRLRNGWPVERALTEPVRAKGEPRRAHVYELAGEMLTAKQLAERFGMNASTLKTRLLRGWSLERAVGLSNS